MPSIDENFNLVKYIIKKNLNGDLPDSSFNMLVNQAQYSYLSHLLGGTETYQNGRPISRVEIGNNQSISQKLSPFIDEPVTLSVDISGNSNFPTDYIAANAMFRTNTTTPQSKMFAGRIIWANQDRLYSYLESAIDPIETNPIYLIQKNKFQFYPTSIGTAKLSYVRKPRLARWNYSGDNNGRHIYNPSTSVDLEWGEIDQWEIVARVLRYVGVNLQAAQVQQFANQTMLQGQ